MRRILCALLLTAVLATAPTSAFAQRSSDPISAPSEAVQPARIGERYKAVLGPRPDVWRLDGTAGQCVQIDMTSAVIDSYLELHEGSRDGRLVASDDDGGQLLDARIQVRLPRTGSYVVVATSAPNSFLPSSGPYTLELSACGGAPATPVSTTPSSPAPATDGLATEDVTVRAIAFRRVAGTRAPLYLGDGVALQQGVWAREAMEIAWADAPRVSGLSLPSSEIPVYLFRDEEQFDDATRQMVGRAFGHGGCSALLTGRMDRGIYCNTSGFRSRDKMLDYLTHELTHQLIQGDRAVRREVPSWYHEGLAEAVMYRVLTVHGPRYAAEDASWRERLVLQAVHDGTYVRLANLRSSTQWSRVPSRDLAYSEARLALNWLVERYGMEKVTQVVAQTDSTASSFDEAFAAAFGMTIPEFDERLAASLRDAGPPMVRIMHAPLS